MSDIYTSIELNRQRPEKVVEIYESADAVRIQDSNQKMANKIIKRNLQPRHTGGRCSKLTAVIFMLLCFLLLVIIVLLGVKLKKLTTQSKQLQTRYSSLTERNQQLQMRCNNLTIERNQLQKERLLLLGWKNFSSSFYYFPTEKKSWTESKDYCTRKGAHLIIINSKDEQDFAQKFTKEFWIGLSDKETEGVWKWVDDTPLGNDTSFWLKDEPNNHKKEDCVEVINGG